MKSTNYYPLSLLLLRALPHSIAGGSTRESAKRVIQICTVSPATG